MIAAFVQWARMILFSPRLYVEFVDKKTVLRPERFGTSVPLTASGRQVIAPRSGAYIPTGIKATFGPWYWALIAPYHPILFKHNLMVLSEVLSPSNGSEVHVPVWNMSDDEIVIIPGQRIGRLIPMRQTICRIAPILSVHKVQEQLGLTNR